MGTMVFLVLVGIVAAIVIFALSVDAKMKKMHYGKKIY